MANEKKVYEKLMLDKGIYGFPLWNPEPSTTIVEHGKKGVQVGDVGFLNGEGAFEYLFTIAASKDDARNSLIKKYSFEPKLVGWAETDISTRPAFPAGHCESTKSIQRKAFDASVGAKYVMAPGPLQLIYSIF
jgi:hypothetical protein